MLLPLDATFESAKRFAPLGKFRQKADKLAVAWARQDVFPIGISRFRCRIPGLGETRLRGSHGGIR